MLDVGSGQAGAVCRGTPEESGPTGVTKLNLIRVTRLKYYNVTEDTQSTLSCFSPDDEGKDVCNIFMGMFSTLLDF